MIRHGKETDTLDLGEIVGSGGRFNLALDRSKYQKPSDCSCGISYARHGTVYLQLPEALASWRQVYFRERYYHRETNRCDNDGKSLRSGPGYLSQWSAPLLDSLYVLGLSNQMISHLLPKGGVDFATVWRRVHDLDPVGLAIHVLLHYSLQHDLNRWSREDKKDISEFFTMTVISPPTAGLAVEVSRPIHQLTLRWIDQRAGQSLQHPTQGSLSFHLI